MYSYFRASRALIVGLGLLSASAFAQATRTWVSAVGDDVNPCSRTAPCQTFAGTISKTAVRGEIDTLDAGEFEPVTITKAITLDGASGGTVSLSTSAAGNGITINAGTDGTVVLRRLTISGFGVGTTGIKVVSARAVLIEDCVITGFTGDGIDFSPDAGGKLFLKNVVLNKNGGAGVRMTTTGTTPVTGTFQNVTASGNATGIAAGANSRVTLVNSTATTNSSAGLVAESGGGVAELTVEHSLISKNGVGASATGAGAIVRLSNSTLIDSVTGPLNASDSGKLLSYGNNRIAGDTSALTSAKEVATLTFTATPNPRPAGTTPELAVTLTGGTGEPTGRIAFKFNNRTVATADVADRSVIFTPDLLPDGLLTLVASYEGDELFAPVDSEPLELTTTGTSSGSGGGGCSAAGGVGLSLLGVTIASAALARRHRHRA